MAAAPGARRARRVPGHARRPGPQDRPGALRPRPAAHRASRRRRRPLRGQRGRQAGAAVDRRTAEGRTQRPACLRRRGQRHQHHRGPRPGPPVRRPGRRVAADVRRERPHHAGQLLASRHERCRLGRGPGPLPSRARPAGHPRRPGGPPVGGARRTRHLARLRHPRGGGFGGGARQGLLGADISRHEDGSWRVDRVLPAEASDPEARSPLAAPGVAIRPGTRSSPSPDSRSTR